MKEAKKNARAGNPYTGEKNIQYRNKRPSTSVALTTNICKLNHHIVLYSYYFCRFKYRTAIFFSKGFLYFFSKKRKNFIELYRNFITGYKLLCDDLRRHCVGTGIGCMRNFQGAFGNFIPVYAYFGNRFSDRERNVESTYIETGQRLNRLRTQLRTKNVI